MEPTSPVMTIIIRISVCEPVARRRQVQWSLRRSIDTMAEGTPEAKAVLDKLRSALKRRGAEGIRGLARHFKIVDRSKTGVLDAEEFEQACKLNQLGLSTTDVHTLVKAFDKDGHEMVSYHEFLRAVRGRLSPARKAMVKKIFDVLDKCALPTGARACRAQRGRR